MLKTFKILLLALVLSLALPTNAYADTEDSTATVSINTTTPTNGVAPVNPDNPTIDRVIPNGSTAPIDVLNPATGNTGPFTIDTVPSFVFQELNGSTYTDPILASGQKTLYTSYTTPYVQVSDRRGLGTGWKLALKATEMSAYSDATTQIVGAPKIPFTLNLVTETTNPIGQRGFALGSHVVALAPDTPAASYTIAGTTTPTDTRILAAQIGKGSGTWILRFKGADQGTSLSLNTDLARKNGTTDVTMYKSTLTWTLSDAPGQ